MGSKVGDVGCFSLHSVEKYITKHFSKAHLTFLLNHRMNKHKSGLTRLSLSPQSFENNNISPYNNITSILSLFLSSTCWQNVPLLKYKPSSYQMNVIFMPEKQYQIHIKEKIVLYKDLPGKDLEMNYVEAHCAPLMKILVCSQMFYWGRESRET